MQKYYLCPKCGPVEVDWVHNGIGYQWHGVHCGWGHTFTEDELVNEDEARASFEPESGD